MKAWKSVPILLLIAVASGCVNSTYLIPVDTASADSIKADRVQDSATRRAMEAQQQATPIVAKPVEEKAANNFNNVYFYFTATKEEMNYYLDIIHSIPAEYVEGLREIRILKPTKYTCKTKVGMFYSAIIEICNSGGGYTKHDFKEILQEELTHFSLYKDNPKLYWQVSEHGDYYHKRYREMWR